MGNGNHKEETTMYKQFKDENGEGYGSFEVFEVVAPDEEGYDVNNTFTLGVPSKGWYWWPCFPGCLPDGEANGPFGTEAEAIADAQS
jgi:hypothetical protein